VDRGRLTPAQRRLLEELLAIDEPRPEVDLELAGRLRDLVETRAAPALDLLPDGETLGLNKSQLAALACDGRFLDLDEGEFAWAVPMVHGKLAHRAVELDWRSGREQDPSWLVERAWAELAEEGDLGEFLDGLDPVDRGELRSGAAELVTEVRDLWPPVPTTWSPRLETPLSVTFAGGRIRVRGKTDLTIGRVRADQRQMIIVDLKSGWRRPDQERQDLRLYGLLATIKYGVAPFRLATYYLSEGAWDVEEVTPAILEGAAQRVADGAVRAARLRYARPADADLELVTGRYCRWCGRAETCPAYAADDRFGD
jgi:hypothetical protein